MRGSLNTNKNTTIHKVLGLAMNTEQEGCLMFSYCVVFRSIEIQIKDKISVCTGLHLHLKDTCPY